MALIQVRRLLTCFHPAPGVTVRAVDGVTFDLERGETLGLIGESGCGKSTVALSLLRLIPPEAATLGGEVWFGGTDLMGLSHEAVRRVRWRHLALVPQSAMNALNPVLRVGEQIAEPMREHLGLDAASALRQARDLLEHVRLDRRRFTAYPHELSGGMKQRVAIAMALACRPDVLIADEATTGLDLMTQAGIIGLLKSLQAELGLSLILISHDLPLVLEVADRVAIMYAGQIVEARAAEDLRRGQAGHPYTQGLLAAFPPVLGPRRRAASIPGAVPDLADVPPGCRFHPRCPVVHPRCREVPPERHDVGTGWASCHLIEDGRPPTAFAASPADGASSPGGLHPDGPAALRSEDLWKQYPRGGGLLRPAARVTAVAGLSLTVRPGEILGLAGESGCGKSTAARLLIGLEAPTRGAVFYDGVAVASAGSRPGAAALRRVRREMAIIFQDPYESLNPNYTVLESVEEPLVVHLPGLSRAERRVRVTASLADVDLTPPERFLDRYPHQLSGGQRQRVAVARALVLGPRVVIADEPTSMLDVSVRASILETLLRLRGEYRLAYVFITHDLAAARYVCDRIAVMYSGRLVEIGPAGAIIERPGHPYTRALVAVAGGILDFLARAEELVLPGQAGATSGEVAGCIFASRCPFATELCRRTSPPWVEVLPGQHAACHHVDRVLAVDTGDGTPEARRRR